MAVADSRDQRPSSSAYDSILRRRLVGEDEVQL
jgi:hypothetical protein